MSRKNREEIKYLETIKSELEGKLQALKVQKNGITNDIAITSQNINQINQKIEKIKKSDDVIISEHAIIRYIERVLKIDIEDLNEKILTSKVKEQIKVLGNGTYPINEGEFRIVIKDNVVVTILTND